MPAPRPSGEMLAEAMQDIKTNPEQPEAWQVAGYLLLSHKKWNEAAQLLTLATATHSTHALLHAYHALALTKTGQTLLAYRQVERALLLQPDLPEALLARVEILGDAGYYDLALQASHALQDKNMPETAAFCLGSLSFITGDFAGGMKILASTMNAGWKGVALPEWQGEQAPDQHVVLYGGQGFGDTIQFIRYVERARKLVGKITLCVPESLTRLMRDSFADIAVVTEKELPVDMSMRCAFPSLANFTDAGFEALAETAPYLRANTDLAAGWRERLARVPRPRIGLAWSSPMQMNSPARMMDFEKLRPLIDVAAPHLVSLQMGAESQYAVDAGLFDASPFIKDFADSAALMAELDLIITLDSAPAHLAGALGKPVWLFLPFNAEWRWLIGREDSIWYSQMRLFRQNQPWDWVPVIDNITTDLKLFLSGNTDILKPAAWEGEALQRHPQALRGLFSE